MATTTDQQATIVCATDFSPNAAAALRWAAVVAAAQPGDRIDLITVLSPPTTSFPELAMDAALLDTVLFETATERLRALAEATEREHGLEVTAHVLSGEPHRAIMAHAEGMRARLVVIGAHAGSTVERWVLGSVAERTVRIATRPVAIVPPGDQTARHLAGPQARPLRVLVGLEGEVAGERALALAGDMRRRRPCDVTVLHFYWPLAEYRRLGLQGSRDLFVPDPDVIRNLEPALRARVGDLPGQGAVEISIRPAWGDPAGNLLAAVDDGEYEILIVGAERRHGLARLWQPSVSQRLARGSDGAVVICVPPPASPRPASVVDVPPRLATVLAPTDLSPAGNAAIPYAYALLAAHGGTVELCHVHHEAIPEPPYAYERPRLRLTSTAVADLERQLRALVPPFAERLGVRTHVSIIEAAAPAEAIVQASERLVVDAISLGSRGRGSLARALLGSVVQKVVQTSRKPVVVVPPAHDPPS